MSWLEHLAPVSHTVRLHWRGWIEAERCSAQRGVACVPLLWKSVLTVRRLVQGEAPTFEELEASMLGGQKLQGVLTSDEVQEVLRDRGWERDYPLFTATNRIVSGAADVRRVLEFRAVAEEELEGNGEDPFGVAAAIQAASDQAA